MAQNKDKQIIAQSTLKLTQEWGSDNGYALTLKDLVLHPDIFDTIPKLNLAVK